MKPSAVARSVDHLINVGRVPFLWGAPGVGKSDVIAETARTQGRKLIDVRLSLLDPVDMKGFPVPDIKKGQMRWLPAEFLPTEKTGPSLLFLDEMNTAPAATQAAAFQLTLNRCIGEYQLPDDCAIVAAGNRDSDRSVTHRMPSPLANRLVHIDFDVDLDDWSNWALKHNVTPEVLGFLRLRTDLLHKFDPKDNPRAFPSPRSWMFVNDIIGSKLAPDEEFEIIKGTVGEGAAGEFVAFQRIVKDLPSVEQIMLNPKTTPVPEKPNVLYAITAALGTKASRDNFDTLMQYAGRMPTEFQVVFVRDSIKRNDDVTKTKSFVRWSIDHSDVLI